MLQNIRAKGRAWLASAVWRKAVSMVVLLTWSYAPMPSTDRIMSVGSAPVASWRLWTKASDPARVASANWYGWHALSKVCAKCWAMVRATSRRRKSPTTSPQTAPEGFWKATSLPRLRACIADAGVLPWATSCDTPPGRHQKLQGHPKEPSQCLLLSRWGLVLFPGGLFGGLW